MLSQTPALTLSARQRLAVTPGMQRQIALLALDPRLLEQHLAALLAGQEDVELRPSQTHCIARLFPHRAAPPWDGLAKGSGGGLAPALAVAPDAGLIQHAEAQIGLLFRDAAAQALARAMLPWLAPTGWLDLDLPELAHEIGVDPARLAPVLARLQQAEPAGLFARDLAECLRLQARDRGLLDPVMAVVLDNLPLLAQGALERLAELAGSDTPAITERLRRIRGLDPKPGLRFGTASQPLPEPDLILRQRTGGWLAALNPRLRSEVAARHPAGRARAAELGALLEFRDSTLLRVGHWLAQAQRGWLEHGLEGLRPMTRRGLAADLDLHETTIGRALRHRLVQTPQGMFVLDHLFGAAPVAGAGLAPQAVALRIKALIAAEPPARPLSDAALAAALAREGIPLARRTVAKYRAGLRIPGQSARRKA